MTLSEIINQLDNNKIKYSLDSRKEIEVVYYWYHHMIPESLRTLIQLSIISSDFDYFMSSYNNLNTDGICYLPSTASIYCGDEYIGQMSILDKTAFSMITYSECECG